jgi:uncharacterized membrane protein YkvA (DUF1232 family)
VPDVVRLVRRLAADRSLPRAVRVRLWLLLGYLLSPVDLVPDFLPVIGYADDVVVVAWALRSLVRRAGAGAVERHWPGSAAGLDVVRRLAGMAGDGVPPNRQATRTAPTTRPRAPDRSP